jgi:hypothetical protein
MSVKTIDEHGYTKPDWGRESGLKAIQWFCEYKYIDRMK